MSKILTPPDELRDNAYFIQKLADVALDNGLIRLVSVGLVINYKT
jgi:hypothetical protein